MRRRLFVAVLSAGACSVGEPELDCEQELDQVRELIRRGELASAAEGCARCLDRLAKREHFALERRFRILYADVLILQSKREEALAALAPIPADDLQGEDAVAYWMHLGFATALESDPERGVRLLDHAEKLSLQASGAPLLPDIVFRRATVAARQGDYDAARPRLEEAIELAQERGDERVEAMAIGNLAYILFDLRRYDEALDWYERSIPLSERAGAQNTLAKELGNRGRCLILLGRRAEAKRSLERALEIQQVAPNAVDRQNWLGNLGALAQDAGAAAEAREYYGRALDIARSAGNRGAELKWLNNLATTFLDAGEISAAERYNELALSIDASAAEPSSALFAQLDRARIEAARDRTERAEQIFRQVIERTESMPELRIAALARLAELHISLSRDSEAERRLQQAIDLVQRSRAELYRADSKMGYLSTLMRPYRAFVDLLMRQGRAREALAAADSSRALTLSERVAAASAAPPRSESFDGLEKTGADAALFYWLAEPTSYLWRVGPGGVVESFDLPSKKEVQSLVAAYQTRLVERGRDPIESGDAAGLELYDILVRPVADRLPAQAKVLLSPDGALNGLSFDSLLAPDPLRYWIEDVSLRITPSLRFGLGAERGARRDRKLLLVGDPEPVSDAYPRLPSASLEMRSLRKRWPARTETLSGQDASVHSFFQARPERFDLIHFAAHAESNAESPLDSAVILSPRRGGYKLYARDVLDARLEADLVTLSACRSAGAAQIAGEGLVGFAWAFLSAGARQVIAGLWNVADASTASLMDHLYAGLAAGREPADALRDAKLALIQEGGVYRKPFYWAPFQTYSA